ncbi:MAG: DNA-3-methyladenine glycosylase I [Candidatus Marinimicrobia bacterium]|nr:DNA-3-methyladenine glycosylase I [Candidatus Neomarinimicrobiota bacterium]MBL7030247.1 DNA-3-methyladenine glycosylase I [Candidatus Neomarinimicrobiota bacterium]
MTRCEWAGTSPLYEQYHDEEWGVPTHDDRSLFEFLILEGAQAGLSWETILKKRKGYQDAFDQFDAKIISTYSESKIEALLQNPNIIRNKLKVNSAVTNAKLFLDVQREFGSFNQYIWQFTQGKTLQNSFNKMSDIPANTPESDAMSQDLKKRGFKFIGTTICYAYMQSMGMVNDHVVSCFRYKECAV